MNSSNEEVAELASRIYQTGLTIDRIRSKLKSVYELSEKSEFTGNFYKTIFAVIMEDIESLDKTLYPPNKELQSNQ